ncbi:Probable chromosome-partitioning protein parB [Megamonas hypermegale]|uniref:Probable chromosome-partitioning protein parB n=1 Tax=Megamonas hypermegale TaxID=158847 RepID=A0A239U4D2_9FIRM|nr:ParB/RepB/Spo0J family partition protein [Megamonas hypermegale]SNV04288.1 Probable chromosome-partitioning protein parB [Megamonas hypermegale]
MEYLKIDEILPNPFQPRQDFSADEMIELTTSIKEYGIIEPLIVRINNQDKFELIAGERRLRAAQMAGLSEVPVILKDYDDKKTAQIALIENLQRSNLNAIEEAHAYKSLTEKFSMTQDEVARKVGKSRSHIANFMRLLKLTKPIQELISIGKLNMGQAKPLLSIEDEKLQQKVANLVIEKELSARKTEELVKKILKNDTSMLDEKPEQEDTKIYLRDVAEQLKQILGTNVSISQGKKKSRIEIEFYSDDDLDRIIELLLSKQKNNTSKVFDFNV